MLVVTALECEAKEIKKFPYRGEYLDVKGVDIRWLSSVGANLAEGTAEYGLRYFTIQPGGEIPIHKHFYSQTMYFLSGTTECECYDEEDDRLLEKVTVKAGDSVFVKSMEPHGMRNVGTDVVSFLCCICNVYEGESNL